MTKITKLEFVPLDLSNKIYLTWTLDIEIHLISKGLMDTIKEENKELL